WTTNHHLLAGEACAVVNAWGFKPKVMLTWGKPHFGCGQRLRGQTEHCILAVRGTPIQTLTNESTLMLEPTGKHSEKPERFYELVESLCPAPAYLELFARRLRPGWMCWGDEVPLAVSSATESRRRSPQTPSGRDATGSRWIESAVSGGAAFLIIWRAAAEP